MLWCMVVFYDRAWFGILWYGMVLAGCVRCGMEGCGGLFYGAVRQCVKCGEAATVCPGGVYQGGGVWYNRMVWYSKLVHGVVHLDGTVRYLWCGTVATGMKEGSRRSNSKLHSKSGLNMSFLFCFRGSASPASPAQHRQPSQRGQVAPNCKTCTL